MALPRLLTIMGSGETAPTMVRVHRRLLERVGGGPAVVLDTPYGFQENADDLTQEVLQYFDQSVGYPIAAAVFRSADDPPIVRETAANLIRQASYVFTGPGSPTYALRQWVATMVPVL